MNYGEFYTVNYSQHQICGSMFVDDEWITSIRMNMSTQGITYTTDFRGHGFKLFQALRNFCKMTHRVVDNGLNRFYADQYITTDVTSHRTFEIQSRAYFDEFTSLMINNLQFTLQLSRDMIHVNAFWSARRTNYLFFIVPGSIVAGAVPLVYRACSCDLSVACGTLYMI